MSDLIEREDVITAILLAQRVGGKEEKKWAMAIEAISDIPSATEWIPCSERLPSEYGEYLATVDGEAIEVSYVPKTLHQGLIKGWSTCEADGFKKLSDDEVIAWMPLPSPYKEGGAE